MSTEVNLSNVFNVNDAIALRSQLIKAEVAEMESERLRIDNLIRVSIDPASTSDALLQAVEGATYEVLKNIMQHRAVTDKILHEIFHADQNITNNQFRELRKDILSSPNCSPELITLLFADGIYSIALITALIQNRNTPVHILRNFLPNPWGVQIPEAIKIFACLNLSTPVLDAFQSLQHVSKMRNKQIVWDVRVVELKAFLTQEHNIDVTDWPREWVEEFVYTTV